MIARSLTLTVTRCVAFVRRRSVNIVKICCLIDNSIARTLDDGYLNILFSCKKFNVDAIKFHILNEQRFVRYLRSEKKKIKVHVDDVSRHFAIKRIIQLPRLREGSILNLNMEIFVHVSF
jgi:hypothetical protein